MLETYYNLKADYADALMRVERSGNDGACIEELKGPEQALDEYVTLLIKFVAKMEEVTEFRLHPEKSDG